jgi:hypothetical protein
MKNTLIGMNVKELIAELERRMQDRGIMEIDLKRLEREWADQATRHQLLGQVGSTSSTRFTRRPNTGRRAWRTR